MRRRNGSGRLQRTAADEAEINPMDGLANLSDVMLVFACGLMLALITYWNVDVGGTAQTPVDVEQGEEITDVEGLDDESGKPMDDAGLEQYGTVYRDPATGKLYMVAEEETP
jgi:hypothetical protein